MKKALHDAGTVPLPHSLKQKIKDGLVALSLSNLCFIAAWFSPLYDSDLGFFNNLRVTPPTLLALAANILWLALLVWLVMQALHRFQNRIFHVAAHFMFFLLLFIPMEFARGQLRPAHSLVHIFKQPAGIFIGAVAFSFILWQHRQIARIAAIVVAWFSPMAFFNLLRVALLCLGVVHLRQAADTAAMPPLNPVRENQPRVVWIIFDELDYRLVFEQPPAGFQFPEFDRLRDESLSANNAYSPADKTIVSIPSLISGRRALSVVLTNSSDLFMTLYKTGSVVNVETTNWSQLPTVFSAAHALGVNTAVVGWFIPYSRLLSPDLNYCEWHPFPSFEPARATTFGGAMLREIECLAGPAHIQQGFVNMYQDMMAESRFVTTNGNYGLVLLHLFPPHVPGIYLPDKSGFSFFAQSDPKAYLDNLVLADRSLGQLRRDMEASGEWDKTWVIVSADHSWRNSKSYDGRRDYRVPFLVKPAGASTPTTFSTQFNTALTSNLIQAILKGNVTNGGNLVAWLEIHGLPMPTSNGTFIEGAFSD